MSPDRRWLRAASEADIDGLLALEQQAFATDRISRRSWRALSTSASAMVLVAQAGDALVGSAVVLLRRGSGVARLYSLAVSAQQRQAGLGRALALRACELARERGCREMRLESRSDNRRAHALFRALGFVPWGAERPSYYADGASAVRFRLALHPPFPQAKAAAGAARHHPNHQEPS